MSNQITISNEDYKEILKDLKESTALASKLQLENIRLQIQITDLKIDLEHYKKVAQDMSKF